MIAWSNFLEMVINAFKNKGYTFNHIADMNNINIAYKLDMSYEYYLKHTLHAVEWRLNAMMSKNKNLIIKIDRSRRHPLVKKFSHVLVNNL